jgi:hypothetical protein
MVSLPIRLLRLSISPDSLMRNGMRAPGKGGPVLASGACSTGGCTVGDRCNWQID